MLVNKKVSNNLKIVVLLLFMSVILFVFSGCNNALVQELELIEESWEAADDNSGDDFIDSSGDVFVNGLNQTYMDANKLTEDELLNMIIAANKSDAGEANAGSRAAASGSDLFNIMTNFEDYFTINVKEYKNTAGTTTSADLQIGLNTSLLTTPLRDFKRVIKDTRYNWQEISNFSIEKLQNQFVYLKGTLKLKAWTALPFNGRLKIADKTAEIKIKVEFLFDETVNGIGYAYEVTDVNIEREWYELVLVGLAFINPAVGVNAVIINEIHRSIVKGKIYKDGRDFYFVELGNYLDPEYFQIMPTTSTDIWLYLNFRATSKGLDLVKVASLILFPGLKLKTAASIIHYQYLYTKVYPSEDTVITNVNNGVTNYANSNYGGTPYFWASSWTYSGHKGEHRSLMKFSTSSLPGNIVSATLYLFGIGGHNPLTKSNACYIQRVTSSWSENSVTWNSQPSVTTSSQKSISASTSASSNAYVELSEWTKRWKSFIPFYSYSNHGIMLRLQVENYYTKMQFASREYATAGKRPYLLVRYYTRSVVN